MKKEVKMLLEKATDSLILSIELFNRPQEQCRHTGALILLDHSFEMILKAATGKSATKETIKILLVLMRVYESLFLMGI